MSIQNDWNAISNTYNTLNSKFDEMMKLKYLEINNDNYISTSEVVSIGCLCNNHSTNSKLKMTQFWNMPDTLVNNVTNAKKIINQYYWSEKQKINGNTIEKKPGLACKTNAASDYAKRKSTKHTLFANVNFFEKVDVTSYMTDFAQQVQANTAIDLFGYFSPDITGDWTFDILPSDGKLIFSSLWISNDNAVYDYTTNNMDISPGDEKASFTITLIQGEYYSIRLQIANMSSSPTNGNILTVKSPRGDLITSINGSYKLNYFVTLMNGAKSIYYRQLLYFGFTQSSANLYNCYFISPPNDESYTSIKALKVNQPIQLQDAVVPLSITYSGDEIITNVNTTPTKILLPPGVKINVTSAKWGILQPAVTYYYTPITVPATGFVQSSINSVVGDQYSSEPGQLVNYALQPYNYPSTKRDQRKDTKTLDLSADVTTKIQGFVNINSLQIDSPYTNSLGDPTATYLLDQKYDLQLQIKYSYNSVVDQSAITNPYLYLDNTGKAIIGYTWGGVNCKSDFTFDTTYKACSMQCTYQLVLDNNGKLCIYDGSNLITSKDLPNIMNININECIVNDEWLANPNNKTSLSVSKKLGAGGENGLFSVNGKFQLLFSGNQLILEYCLNPNKTTTSVMVSDNSVAMHYTTAKNIDILGNQIYYLYRLNNRGISGQRFMSQTNASKNILHYVPPYPSSNNILKFVSFESQNGLNPLSFPMDNNPNYTVISQNVTDNSVCNKSCVNSPECDHYFYLTDKKQNNYCFLDNKNIINPIYTTTSISNIESSTLNKKQYAINTTCGSLPNKNLEKVTDNTYNDGALSFVDLAKNAPNLTYYCGLSGYQKGSDIIMGIYNKDSVPAPPSGTMASKATVNSKQSIIPGSNSKESFTTNDKQFYQNSPYKITDHSNINYLSQMSTEFSNLENKIGDNRLKINNTIGRYVDLSNNLGTDINYKFTGPDAIIPDKYEQTLSSLPKVTFNDGVKRDLEIIATQQNTLYTIAAITTASLIIMTIFIIK